MQATAGHGHRPQKTGLPEGGIAAEHVVSWKYNQNNLKIGVGLFECFLFYANLIFYVTLIVTEHRWFASFALLVINKINIVHIVL